MSDRAVLQAMLARWLVALNHRGQGVAAAVADQVAVQRFGFHYQRGELVEELHGPTEVAQWLARTAPVVRFELDPGEPVQTGPGAWQVRYVVSAPDDFLGGGLWDIRLDDHGLLRYLGHHPDDLAPEHWGPPPAHADHDQTVHDQTVHDQTVHDQTVHDHRDHSAH